MSMGRGNIHINNAKKFLRSDGKHQSSYLRNMVKAKERMDWDEGGGWDKTQIMEGLSSYLKDFGLYSKSNEKPLKALK